jgi:hypothetical protein
MLVVTTKELAELNPPGGPLFGIDASNGGRVVIFAGAVPIRIMRSPRPGVAAFVPGDGRGR